MPGRAGSANTATASLESRRRLRFTIRPLSSGSRTTCHPKVLEMSKPRRHEQQSRRVREIRIHPGAITRISLRVHGVPAISPVQVFFVCHAKFRKETFPERLGRVLRHTPRARRTDPSLRVAHPRRARTCTRLMALP